MQTYDSFKDIVLKILLFKLQVNVFFTCTTYLFHLVWIFCKKKIIVIFSVMVIVNVDYHEYYILCIFNHR